MTDIIKYTITLVLYQDDVIYLKSYVILLDISAVNRIKYAITLVVSGLCNILEVVCNITWYIRGEQNLVCDNSLLYQDDIIYFDVCM